MQVDYWAIDPPPGGDEDVCVAMNMTDGKWYPKPCNEKYPSLCKHSEGIIILVLSLVSNESYLSKE